jgi:hypothetical protein
MPSSSSVQSLEAIRANHPLFHACLQQLDSCMSHVKPLALGKFIKLFLSMVSPPLVNEQFLLSVTSKRLFPIVVFEENDLQLDTRHAHYLHSIHGWSGTSFSENPFLPINSTRGQRSHCLGANISWSFFGETATTSCAFVSSDGTPPCAYTDRFLLQSVRCKWVTEHMPFHSNHHRFSGVFMAQNQSPGSLKADEIDG